MVGSAGERLYVGCTGALLKTDSLILIYTVGLSTLKMLQLNHFSADPTYADGRGLPLEQVFHLPKRQ